MARQISLLMKTSGCWSAKGALTTLYMSKKHQLGKLAAECAARRSPLFRFKTGCAFIKDDDPDNVIMGWSHRGAQLTQTPWSTHAELHAAQRARWSRDLEGATAYICTLTKSGNMTSGRPCNESCFPLIRRLGFVSVVYSISNNVWEEESV
jgi:pyrimidine deaminase RibD-like protein